ncbi:hypothetical protein [Actinomadura sp. 3N407]|uniref:hypothetical protein n=1 Tax=Actinomadura sp. 3N407 TaxID=3457423 RepID=UPI003FCD8F8D
MPRLREVPRAEVTDEQILFFYDHLFAPDRPEPIVEVAAPEGYGDRDISADLTGDR